MLKEKLLDTMKLLYPLDTKGRSDCLLGYRLCLNSLLDHPSMDGKTGEPQELYRFEIEQVLEEIKDLK